MEAIAKLIITLMHAGTAAHVLHLQATGPGSYARHKALDDFYKGIIDKADSIAEAWQGRNRQIIVGYPDGYVNPPQDGSKQAVLDFLTALLAFVDETRTEVDQRSEIQNLIDEAVSFIDDTIYFIEQLQ
jgi:DNA-binding ferritin-like protein